MTGLDLVYQVSLDLNDQEPGHEYARWTQEQLSYFYKEAAFTVYAALSEDDIYLRKRVVQLQPGIIWQSGCDCTKIIRVIGECDQNGRVSRLLRKIDDSDDYWGDGCFINRCEKRSDYRIASYSLSNTEEGEFRVNPPVPNGVTKHVLLECTVSPTGDVHEAVPDRVVTIIKQWMLFRAFNLDGENNTAMVSLAENHHKMFTTLLGLELEKMKRDAEEAKSGNLRTVQDKSSE